MSKEFIRVIMSKIIKIGYLVSYNIMPISVVLLSYGYIVFELTGHTDVHSYQTWLT